MVRTQSKLLTVSQDLRKTLTADPAALKLKHVPNSVDTLAPNNRFVVAIIKIPMTKEIPYHSIIGHRGRGDTPNSSDGAVAYGAIPSNNVAADLSPPFVHLSPSSPHTSACAIALSASQFDS